MAFLLRNGVSVVRKMILRFVRSLHVAMERTYLTIVEDIPRTLFELLEAVGAPWIALWVLLFSDHTAPIRKWTQQQLINLEYTTLQYTERSRRKVQPHVPRILTPKTLALSLLGGLVR